MSRARTAVRDSTYRGELYRARWLTLLTMPLLLTGASSDPSGRSPAAVGSSVFRQSGALAAPGRPGGHPGCGRSPSPVNEPPGAPPGRGTGPPGPPADRGIWSRGRRAGRAVVGGAAPSADLCRAAVRLPGGAVHVPSTRATPGRTGAVRRRVDPLLVLTELDSPHACDSARPNALGTAPRLLAGRPGLRPDHLPPGRPGPAGICSSHWSRTRPPT